MMTEVELHRRNHEQLSDRDVILDEQDLAVDLTSSPVAPTCTCMYIIMNNIFYTKFKPLWWAPFGWAL